MQSVSGKKSAGSDGPNEKTLLVYITSTFLMWSVGFTKTMTRDELKSFRTMKLGKLAAEKINSHYVSRSDRDINDLFHILYEIAKRVIYSNYRGIETHLLDDTIAQVSEHVLMLVYKSPEKYINHSNFFYYFKSAITKRALSTLKHFYHLTKNIESLDDPDSTGRVKLDRMCNDFPSVDEIMERRSDAETLINRVTGILENHPFLSTNYKYLVWPIIYSLIHNNDKIFSGLSFRERCAIRVIQAQVMGIISERIKAIS